MPRAGYKCCTRCGEEKPLDLYPIAKRNLDGRWGMCKACKAKRDKAWREAHPERIKELEARSRRRNRAAKAASDKRYAEQNREKIRVNRNRYLQRHPEKARARVKLNNAIRDGVYIKPDRCQDCGEETTPQALHGHHTDYSKPLEVRWLCRGCHWRLHNEAP